MSIHRQVSALRLNHPRASSSGCVYEHVLIAEDALGRYLPEGAEVHHVDGNPKNNARTNLVICQDKAYHKLLHVRSRVLRAGGNPDSDRICSLGKHLAPLSAFNRRRGNVGTGLQTACRACMESARRRRKAGTA